MQLVDNTKLSDMSKSQRDAASVPVARLSCYMLPKTLRKSAPNAELAGLGNRLVHSVVNALHKVESLILLHML
jgi:hypothetical protein